MFDVDDVLRLEAQVLDGFVELVDHAGVEQCVTQLLAHEELGGQVSDGLGVAIDHVLLGLEPCVLQVAADHQRGGDVHVGGGGLLDGDAWLYFSCSRMPSANSAVVTGDLGAVISVMSDSLSGLCFLCYYATLGDHANKFR